jgi:hypothetical protein
MPCAKIIQQSSKNGRHVLPNIIFIIWTIANIVLMGFTHNIVV